MLKQQQQQQQQQPQGGEPLTPEQRKEEDVDRTAAAVALTEKKESAVAEDPIPSLTKEEKNKTTKDDTNSLLEITSRHSKSDEGRAASHHKRPDAVDQGQDQGILVASKPSVISTTETTTTTSSAKTTGIAKAVAHMNLSKETPKLKSEKPEANVGQRKGGGGVGCSTAPAATTAAEVTKQQQQQQQRQVPTSAVIHTDNAPKDVEEDGEVKDPAGVLRPPPIKGRNRNTSGGLMSATVVALRRTPEEIIEKQRVARRSRSNSPMNPSTSRRSTSAIVPSAICQDVAAMLSQSPSDDDDDNSVEGLNSNQAGGRAPIVGAMAVHGAPSTNTKTKAPPKEEESTSNKKGVGKNSYLSYINDANDQQQQPEMATLGRQPSDPGTFHSGELGEITTLTRQQSDPGAFHSGELNEGRGGEADTETEQAPNLSEDTRNRLADLFPSLNPQSDDEEDDSSLGQSSLGQLSVAMPVADELLDLETATHVSELDISRRSRKSFSDVKNEGRRCLPCIILALVILVALMLGCFFLGLHFGKQRGTTITLTASPSSSPPSASPSAAPTGALDLLREGLPDYTLASLEAFDAPQWKAWYWLENHPDLTDMDEWRKKQLFALGAFYYGMDGDNWPGIIKDNWLLYDRSECFWFDTAFGEFNEATGLWEAENYYDDDGDAARSVCNELGEFELLDLVGLELSGYNPFIPPEFTLLTSLAILSLTKNDINTPLADFLPSQLYDMPNLTEITLFNNSFTGVIPSEIGKLRDMDRLIWFGNALTGQLPNELGRLTRMTDMDIEGNFFTGSIPSDLGLMTSMIWLYLYGNSFTGAIPTEVGWMTDLKNLQLQHNALSGSLPTELALLTNSLQELRLENNFFTGTIPLQYESLRVNGSLIALSLGNNSFSGTIPEGLCSLGVFEWGVGLSFDCNEELCGCCWCPCPGSNYTTECETRPFIPVRDDKMWPGAFPVPLNRSNAITINILTDSYPEETSFEWSVQDESGAWKVIESVSPSDEEDLHSYTYEVTSDSIYRLQLFDEYADGNCCHFGFGWFTITSSIPSEDHWNCNLGSSWI